MQTFSEGVAYDVQAKDMQFYHLDLRLLTTKSENALYGIIMLKYSNKYHFK